MGNTQKSKRTIIGAGVLFFFIVSLLNLPIPVEASNPIATPNNPILANPMAYSLSNTALPKDAVRFERRMQGEKLQVVLDKKNTDRIYRISKTVGNQTLTLQYVYDNRLPVVTLLLSLNESGKEIFFTQYFRYALSASNSLELILEEGWVREGILYPAKMYDYFPQGLQIRSFDKAGILLKIETSEGFKTLLLYSRYGELLTLQQIDPRGAITFFDQAPASAGKVSLPSSPYRQALLGVVSGFGKIQKRFDSPFLRKIEPSLNFSQMEGMLADKQASGFLTWLEAAYPVRAGPGGGELK